MAGYFGPTPSESQAPLLGTKSIVSRWIFSSSELRLPTSAIATRAGRAKGFPLQPLVSVPDPLAEYTPPRQVVDVRPWGSLLRGS